MDYKHIKNKSIGIFCNQTAVNRNDNHILDLIGKDKSIDVKAIFEPEYGIWGVDGIKKFISYAYQKYSKNYNFIKNYMGQCLLIKR